MTLRIAIAPSAQVQLEELAEWWQTHRPSASTDLATEFQRVVEVLAQMPFLGRPYRRRRSRNVRHYPIAGTPYHVFHAPTPDRGELRVLAVWSVVRGEAPRS
ncbi:MAG: type II toxin-antitoxin system RelE/ParE family toxin [Deltaproteobacteria bacterium]|nr:type II toxin-antitoxin system RelE/ParE family toxin [Deltaproteobacteria bacterium]